jgi:ACS family hexuronate transporter-like MFS transporter
MGNGVLQSGTSVGSILTPVFMWWIMVQQGLSWRIGFQVVGLVGVVWIVGWLAATRNEDFHVARRGDADGNGEAVDSGLDTIRRWAAVLLVVVVINTVWQILRAWIPLILQKQYGYGETTTLWFNAAWFAVADVGCLAAGWLSWRLAGRGWTVKWSRVATVACCCVLCLALVAVPWISAGPLLLTLFLVAGAGTLGLFPIYYSFTQDVSRHHIGLVTGVASFFGWVASARFQKLFGWLADETHSYSVGIAAAGAVTLFALAAWALLWPEDRADASAAAAEPVV